MPTVDHLGRQLAVNVVRQHDSRPGTDVADDLGRGEAGDVGAARQVVVVGQPEQETGGIQIAGAGFLFGYVTHHPSTSSGRGEVEPTWSGVPKIS